MSWVHAIFIFIFLYILVGFYDLSGFISVKKLAHSHNFEKKNYSLSIIVPVKEHTDSLKDNLRTVCRQDYPDFEVIFVAEERSDSAFGDAEKVANEFPNARFVISGKHNPLKNTGKSHNLIKGVKESRGEVFLFTDSDVEHSPDWASNMTSPLSEEIEGKKISATTSMFFSKPKGFWAIFSALSANIAILLVTFTSKKEIVSYASGASMAVFRKAFFDAKLPEKWENCFNDDLVFASVLYDKGYHIFNQRISATRPMEEFKNFKQFHKKIVRWLLTIQNYQSKRMAKDSFKTLFKNIQFEIFFLSSIILYLFGFDFLICLAIFLTGFVYTVIHRFIAGFFMEEKEIMRYVYLAPVSRTFWVWAYLYLLFFGRSFEWGDGRYVVK